MAPGGVFVVGDAVGEAPVQDADEPIGTEFLLVSCEVVEVVEGSTC